MEIIKKIVVLTIVTSVAAVLLAVTYKNTKPRIDAHMKNELERLRRDVLPRSSGFEEIKIRKEACYIGYDDEGRKAGLILPVSVKGYSGEIKMLIGMSMKGKIEGLYIINQTETPGLGNKIAAAEFTDQFRGLTEKEACLASDGSDGKIDAVTAATISSRAVTGGVKKGFNLYNEYVNYTGKRDILNRVPDGSYWGRGEGAAGPVRVEVVIESRGIKAIKVIRQQEAKRYWAKVKAEIPAKILREQTTEVDTVSGATLTSQGLIDAVQNALESAGRKGK